MRSTESSEAVLRGVVDIWVPIIHRRAQASQYKEGLEVTLEQHVNVYPLADVAAHAHVTAYRVNDVARRRIQSVLNVEPVSVGRHVVASAAAGVISGGERRGSIYLLVYFVRTKKAWQVEVLRDIGPNFVACRQPPEEKLRRDD